MVLNCVIGGVYVHTSRIKQIEDNKYTVQVTEFLMPFFLAAYTI
jgi:hypothetical protein